MDDIKVSVIIPTYDRPKLLAKTIKSFKEQDFSGYEVIIIDNQCSKIIKEIVKNESRNTDPKKCLVMYIPEPNIGLHNARHTGAKAAKAEIILYADDDIIADRNLVKEILTPYSDLNVGCVGGKILPKWEIEPPEWLKLFPECYLSILDDEEGPKEVQWIHGCNFSIRKNLLFELGGFNPDAFGEKKLWWMRGDGEIGLLRKVHNAGKKVIYNPRAVVWHIIPKERLTVKYFKERTFKSGIEASFSGYRYSNSSSPPIKLLMRAGAFGIYYVFHNILASMPNKHSIKYRVTSSYYKARCLYELKLAMDKNLQRFVKKESWLEGRQG